MISAWLAFLDGLMAVALVLAGLVGAHWRFCAPNLGFQFFVFGCLLGAVAVVMGLIGIFATRNPIRARARPRAVVGTAMGLLVILPVLFIVTLARHYPAINDITTDIENPPEFIRAPELPANQGRDMKYDRAKYAAGQQQGYPTLGPLKMPEMADDAFRAAQKTASAMPGWDITRVDSDTRTIEGVATSDLFHFQDDFVIQVRPDPAGAASVVEMRLKSRIGIGDTGTNYKRIESFFTALSNSRG